MAAAGSPRDAPARRAVELELPEATQRRIQRRSTDYGRRPPGTLPSGGSYSSGVGITIPGGSGVHRPSGANALGPAGELTPEDTCGAMLSKSLHTQQLPRSFEVASIPSSGWAGFTVQRAFTEPEVEAECCVAVLARKDSMDSSDTELPDIKGIAGPCDICLDGIEGRS